MRCAEVRQSLVAYLDGESGSGERERIESHLAACDPCLAERAALASTGDMLRVLAGPVLSPAGDDLAERVLRMAREEERREDPWCRHIRRDLVALLDGELDEERARPVESHLEECEACRREKSALARTGDALALWTLPRFDADLVAAVSPAPVPAGRRTRILMLFGPAMAAACLLIVAWLGGALSGGGAPSPGSRGAADEGMLEVVRYVEWDQVEWVESIPDEEMYMLNGRGG